MSKKRPNQDKKRKEGKMTVNETANQFPPTPEYIPLKRKVVDSRKLPWYKTQYWSGFIFGLWVGLLTGMPFAFVVYQIAKVVVHFIEVA